MTRITFGAKTDVGRVRKKNQDSVTTISGDKFAGKADGLFVVADGMGGHAGGEIASRITVETVPAIVSDELARLNGQVTSESLADTLREALRCANEAVWKQARANPELRGMGTTCVAVLVREGTAVIGNVGDSRAYLMRAGRLRQITSDHSLVQEHVRSGEITAEEARSSRYKNVITRAIGLASQVEPDVELMELEESDTLLLCTDGLSGMLEDEEIARILAQTDDVQKACDSLVDESNRNGGEDNISAVVIRHGDFVRAALAELDPASADVTFSAPRAQSYRRPRSGIAVPLLVVLSLVLAGALIAVGRETYEVTSSAPFVRRKPVNAPAPAPKPPAEPNMANITYSAPVVFTPKVVRSSLLACDSAGNVYAATLQTGRIVRIAPGGGTSSDFPVKLPPETAVQPMHWAADKQGNLYVSVIADHVIRKYLPTGTRIAEIGRDSLNAPGAVAVDGSGSVYVVDDRLIKVFRPLTTESVSRNTQRSTDPAIQHPTLSGGTHGAR